MYGPDGPGASPDRTPHSAARRALAVARVIAITPLAVIAALYAALLIILLPVLWQVGIVCIGATIIRMVLQSESAMATTPTAPAPTLIADLRGASLRSELKAMEPEAELDSRLAVLLPGLDVTQRRSAFLWLIQDIRQAVPANQCWSLPRTPFTGAARRLVDQYPFALVRYELLSASDYLIVVKLGRTPSAPDVATAVRVSAPQGDESPVVCVVVALGQAWPPW